MNWQRISMGVAVASVFAVVVGTVGAGTPAVRKADRHVCPMVTFVTPHVGGPVLSGSSNVLIQGMPAARVGDTAGCVGPPAAIVTGSATVLINNKPAAKQGSSTSHGGSIIAGASRVLIGG